MEVENEYKVHQKRVPEGVPSTSLSFLV